MNPIRMLFFLAVLSLNAQSGFHIESGNRATIRFQMINNLIFVPVNINGVDLTFLLDSGVDKTILFSLENKNIDFKNVEKITFTGLGQDDKIDGLKSINNRVRIGENYVDNRHPIYIILNENINLSKHLGIPVNGIIGYEFFKNNPVEINFTSEKIKVHKDFSSIKRKVRRYEPFPISIELHKPYIYANLEVERELDPVKLLLDLGNSDGLWLFPNIVTQYLNSNPHIQDFLGSGFNGDIYGNRTRIAGFQLGSFSFQEPLVAVPNAESIRFLTIVKDRKGSIGNEILRRFRIIIDYDNEKIYLRKNWHYSDPFLFNKSGLTFEQDGAEWAKDYVQVQVSPATTTHEQASRPYNPNHNTEFQFRYVLTPQFSVTDCRTGSPCALAGIEKGDKILAINHQPAQRLTIKKIMQVLTEGKEGEVVQFKLQRKTHIFKTEVTLQDPIPFQKK